MPKITIDGVDITEHVAAMFDALVASLDWGSGFLSTEDVEAILIVGELAGFPGTGGLNPAATSIPGAEFKFNEPRPSDNSEFYAYAARRDAALVKHNSVTKPAAIAAWRAQVAAKVRALKAGE